MLIPLGKWNFRAVHVSFSPDQGIKRAHITRQLRGLYRKKCVIEEGRELDPQLRSA